MTPPVRPVRRHPPRQVQGSGPCRLVEIGIAADPPSLHPTHMGPTGPFHCLGAGPLQPGRLGREQQPGRAREGTGDRHTTAQSDAWLLGNNISAAAAAAATRATPPPLGRRASAGGEVGIPEGWRASWQARNRRRRSVRQLALFPPEVASGCPLFLSPAHPCLAVRARCPCSLSRHAMPASDDAGGPESPAARSKRRKTMPGEPANLDSGGIHEGSSVSVR